MAQMWLVYALLSALAASFVAIFGKMGLQGVDSTTATGIRAVIMALFLAGVLAAEGKLGQVSEIAGNGTAMKYIILSGIAGALSWIFYFIALKLGEASKVAPIDRLSVFFVMVFAAIMLGERISLVKGVGTLLIVLGAIIVALA
jgi:bacterial/archaeal transporter family protein